VVLADRTVVAEVLVVRMADRMVVRPVRRPVTTPARTARLRSS